MFLTTNNRLIIDNRRIEGEHLMLSGNSDTMCIDIDIKNLNNRSAKFLMEYNKDDNDMFI